MTKILPAIPVVGPNMPKGPLSEAAKFQKIHGN